MRYLGQGLLGCLLLLSALATPASPQLNFLSVGWTPTGERWQSWETPHFRIHALARHQHWVVHLAAEAELAHQELAPALQWQPRAKTELVLSDDHDLANGWASALPFAQSRLYLSPPDRFNSLEAYDDWLRLLLRHEYVHVLHLDQASRAPWHLRKVFGRMPLLFPHQFQPVWLIEGLAMHHETEHEAGVGRGQSVLSSSRMRAEVLGEGPVSLSRVTGLNRDWPADQAYLYGVYFYQFLEERLGPEAQGRWLQVYRSKLVPYWMNPSARRAFGRSYPALWEEYQHWLHQQFVARPEAAAPGHAHTATGLFDAPPVARNAAVYRLYQDGHGPARLRRYTASGETDLLRVPHPGLFDIDADETVVMAALRPRHDNRLLGGLYRWHRDQGWTRLDARGRYREARWLPNGDLLARSVTDGISALHWLDRDGRLLTELWRGQPGEVLGGFAVAPSGEYLLASFKQPRRSGWQLAQFDLADRRWTFLTDNGQLQGPPSFSADGQSVVFSADYQGYFDLYRMQLADRQIERIHRSDSAAFSPVQDSDGALWYQRYSQRGYDLYRLDTTQPEAAPALRPAHAPTPIPEPPVLEAMGDYSPWSTLRPHWWLPVFGATADTWQIGAQTSGQDALGRHQYQVLLGWDGLSASPFGALAYLHDNRYLLLAQRLLGFYYDANDVLGYIRAEDSLSATRLNLLSMLDDQASFSLGLFHQRDHDIWRDDSLAQRPDASRSLLGLAWQFDNSQQYWHSISPASGMSLRVIGESHELLGDDYRGRLWQLDGQGYLHLGRSHVLATRLVGVAADDGAAPLRIGGEQPVMGVFGRNRYPLRGYRDNLLYGHRLGLASAEWRFPLARVQQNWGVYPLGLRDVHGKLFVDHGRIWQGPDPATAERAYTGVGADLRSELVLGYRILLPLDIGAARGLDDELGGNRYWLRLGLTF